MAEVLLDVKDLQVLFEVRNDDFRLRDWLKRSSDRDGLTRQVHAVEGVSFTIERGQTVGLVGESGSGKSTIGNAIMRLVDATSGTITLGGASVLDVGGKQLKAIRRKVAMVFQDPLASLDPRRTIRDSVADPLEVHGLHVADREQRISDLMEMVGLSDRFLPSYPHQLSGGQRQRVCIARALAVEPDLIILDEATASLDVSVQAQVMNLLKKLQRDLDLSYLFIAHDLAAVEYMSDKLVVMYLGRTMEIADRSSIYAHAAHPYTTALMSAIPSDDPVAERQRERIVLTGDVPSPLNPPSGCVFRTRCPKATAECAHEIPPLLQLSPLHEAACIHLDE